MLVTTVAALAWVAVPDRSGIGAWSSAIVVGFFGSSVLFAILTLALIPQVAIRITPKTASFYKVSVCTKRLWAVGNPYPYRLMHFCAPQHILFLAGIVVFTAARIVVLIT